MSVGRDMWPGLLTILHHVALFQEHYLRHEFACEFESCSRLSTHPFPECAAAAAAVAGSRPLIQQPTHHRHPHLGPPFPTRPHYQHPISSHTCRGTRRCLCSSTCAKRVYAAEKGSYCSREGRGSCCHRRGGSHHHPSRGCWSWRRMGVSFFISFLAAPLNTFPKDLKKQ